MLDQHALAGVGNLLADEVLWQAAVDPRVRSDEIDDDTARILHRELGKGIRRAIRKGGVQTGEIIAFRAKEARCPRCGGEMVRGTIGGRTTWWCSAEQ